MPLNTQYIDPVTITGYVRGKIDNFNTADPLSAFLPNASVNNTAVRFEVTEAGVVPEAEARDWDAQPATGDLPVNKRRTIDLVAFSQRQPLSESDKLVARMASADSAITNLVLRAANTVALAIYNRARRTRATVLETGHATINQTNFGLDEDFGRAPELTATLGQLLTDPAADALQQLSDMAEVYEEKSGGERPKVALVSSKVINAFATNKQFTSVLADGSTRRANLAQVNSVLEDNELPTLQRFNEKIGTSRLFDESKMIWLPEPVAPDGESALGASIWGLTESAFKPEFSALGSEMPGAVAAVYTADGIAGKTVVDGDATFLPILKNANLSAAIKVI